MANQVKFVTISQEDYDSIEKDEYTHYKCYDTNNYYLGTQQLNNVEVDTTLVWGSFEAPIGTLNDTSWAKIASITEQGLAEQYWSVGDRKAITLNGTVGICEFDNETYYAYILGFDHNAELESNGEHTIHFQFGYTDLEGKTAIAFVDDLYAGYNGSGKSTAFRMNLGVDDGYGDLEHHNDGGWESSYMRNTLMPEFEDCLPSDLQAVLKEVIKYTNNSGQSTYNPEPVVTATTDKCFLLNLTEIGLSSEFQNPYEENYTKTYDFFSRAINTDQIRYKYNSTSTTCYWWSRSPSYLDSETFISVDTSGSDSTRNADSILGVAPAFVV